MSSQLHLIASFGNQGQVGLKNARPWVVPAELQHASDTIANATVIMCLATFQSLGYALPKRRNIVVTDQVGFLPGVEVVPTIERALELVKYDHRVFVIGGVPLWSQALPHATHLVLSEVNYNGVADTLLPAPFFARVRNEFRLNHLRHQEEFTATYWIRHGHR
ncbi:dihydrofolate reductase (plasmid) [Pseudomonas silesiensis]|uniref:dihydrofolate reductase n=1 Tax=Pseudomonas silesiensis TaxID=1853130 RepID=UPI0030D3F901